MIDYKKEYIDLLRSTQRDNIEVVITELEDLGFFYAPASTNFHSNYKEGLLEHSVKVCKVGLMLREQMINMNPDLDDRLPAESVILCTLLHDVCKSDIYKPAVKKRKNHYGIWEEYKGYDVDYSHFPLGHGEKSVIMLLRMGLELTDQEIMAIRWHMTAWDLPFQSPEMKANLNAAKDKTPLCCIVQTADSLA
ncbi:MAG: HD family phosphohydrolase, partial [Parabacteroides sp.]|nr:HD family phosphohydrolase [Parabacteroides sp.]